VTASKDGAGAGVEDGSAAGGGSAVAVAEAAAELAGPVGSMLD
jgi:hypothetical protein